MKQVQFIVINEPRVEVKPSNGRPRIESTKDIKKAKKNAVGPGLSKSERRRLEKEEQEATRRGIEKTKALRRAREARERKKRKEEEEKNEKRKKGLPTAAIRPSQSTLPGLFAIKPARAPQKTECRTAKSLVQTDHCDNNHAILDKENIPIFQGDGGPNAVNLSPLEDFEISPKRRSETATERPRSLSSQDLEKCNVTSAANPSETAENLSLRKPCSPVTTRSAKRRRTKIVQRSGCEDEDESLENTASSQHSSPRPAISTKERLRTSDDHRVGTPTPRNLDENSGKIHGKAEPAATNRTASTIISKSASLRRHCIMAPQGPFNCVDPVTKTKLKGQSGEMKGSSSYRKAECLSRKILSGPAEHGEAPPCHLMLSPKHQSEMPALLGEILHPDVGKIREASQTRGQMALLPVEHQSCKYSGKDDDTRLESYMVDALSEPTSRGSQHGGSEVVHHHTPLQPNSPKTHHAGNRRRGTMDILPVENHQNSMLPPPRPCSVAKTFAPRARGIRVGGLETSSRGFFGTLSQSPRRPTLSVARPTTFTTQRPPFRKSPQKGLHSASYDAERCLTRERNPYHRNFEGVIGSSRAGPQDFGTTGRSARPMPLKSNNQRQSKVANPGQFIPSGAWRAHKSMSTEDVEESQIPPKCTQFLALNLDEWLPSASQEAQELAETDIQRCHPKVSHVDSGSGALFKARQSSLAAPTPENSTQVTTRGDTPGWQVLVPISTQDVLMSSQEMQELESPIKSMETAAALPPPKPVCLAPTLGPIQASRTQKRQDAVNKTSGERSAVPPSEVVPISTQDLFMSTQDLNEVEDLAKKEPVVPTPPQPFHPNPLFTLPSRAGQPHNPTTTTKHNSGSFLGRQSPGGVRSAETILPRHVAVGGQSNKPTRIGQASSGSNLSRTVHTPFLPPQSRISPSGHPLIQTYRRPVTGADARVSERDSSSDFDANNSAPAPHPLGFDGLQSSNRIDKKTGIGSFKDQPAHEQRQSSVSTARGRACTYIAHSRTKIEKIRRGLTHVEPPPEKASQPASSARWGLAPRTSSDHDEHGRRQDSQCRKRSPSRLKPQTHSSPPNCVLPLAPRLPSPRSTASTHQPARGPTSSDDDNNTRGSPPLSSCSPVSACNEAERARFFASSTSLCELKVATMGSKRHSKEQARRGDRDAATSAAASSCSSRAAAVNFGGDYDDAWAGRLGTEGICVIPSSQRETDRQVGGSGIKKMLPIRSPRIEGTTEKPAEETVKGSVTAPMAASQETDYGEGIEDEEVWDTIVT